MKHYNEQILTLYVLKANDVARQRKAITMHLKKCVQCSAIVEDLQAIYADASLQLESKQTQEDAQIALLPAKRPAALQKKIDDLIYEPFRMPVPIPQRNAMQKVWYVAKRYPVASSSISFFALAFIAFFTFQIVKNNYSPEKQSPVDYKIETNFSLALLNKQGEKVGAIDINPKLVTQIENEKKNYGEVQSVKFYDVDNDGVNEVFLSESPVGNSNGTANIHAYFLKHPERNWRYKVNRELTFSDNPEFIIPVYGIGQMLVGDFDNDGKSELITNVKHVGSFPAILIKLDAATGKEINWFYNPGAINRLSAIDINNDGVQEIIVAGANNSYKLPFIAIFDSRNIQGKAPSTIKYEAKDIPWGTMKQYILIPPTKVGKVYSEKGQLLSSVDRVSLYPESRKIKILIKDNNMNANIISTTSSIEIIFNYDLKPLGITTSTEYDAVALDLYKNKKINSLPDKKYFDEYLQTLQYWNGTGFQTKSTVNSHYLEELRKKEGIAHLP